MKLAYRIVQALSTVTLTSDVQKYIKIGWKPQGGVSAGPVGFFQAMIKEISEPSDFGLHQGEKNQ